MSLLDFLNSAAFQISGFTGGFMVLIAIGQLMTRPLKLGRVMAAGLFI